MLYVWKLFVVHCRLASECWQKCQYCRLPFCFMHFCWLSFFDKSPFVYLHPLNLTRKSINFFVVHCKLASECWQKCQYRRLIFYICIFVGCQFLTSHFLYSQPLNLTRKSINTYSEFRQKCQYCRFCLMAKTILLHPQNGGLR